MYTSGWTVWRLEVKAIAEPSGAQLGKASVLPGWLLEMSVSPDPSGLTVMMSEAG
jgi:hypothetical protein